MVKNFKINMNHLAALCLLICTVAGLHAQNVQVTVTELRSDKGQISVGIFLDEDSFRAENAYRGFIFHKNDIQDGTLTFTLNLEPGLYGLSVLDDVDSDTLMDYNMLGLPREGFGFSDYYHSGFSRPKFDSFCFTLEEGETKEITVRMRYL